MAQRPPGYDGRGAMTRYLLLVTVGPVQDFIAQARRTRSVVRQNLAWAAGYNAVCVPLAVAGMMPPWAAGIGMAASSLFVVLNAARLGRAPSLGCASRNPAYEPIPSP